MTSSKSQEFNHDIICGIDEAGRGPVLGPMVICGVCFFEAELKLLVDIGVKDSKKLSSKKRSELAALLHDMGKVFIPSAILRKYGLSKEDSC